MRAYEALTQSSPHAEVTEQELVQRVQAGDATAFDALFRQCCSKVFHQATRLLGNAAEAEEVVQEVFLAVYEKAHTFRGDATFTTWLFRLTANAALSRLRRRKRSKEVAMEEYLSFNPMAITWSAPWSTGPRIWRSVWLRRSCSGSSGRPLNSCNPWTGSAGLKRF